METPEKAAVDQPKQSRVDMLTAKRQKAEVQAQIAATQASIKKKEKEVAIAKKKADEAQRKTDALNAARARRQQELDQKEALAAEREARRLEQQAKNAEAKNSRKATITERRQNVEACNRSSRLDSLDMTKKLEEEKKAFEEFQLEQRRQCHDESYTHKKNAKAAMNQSMENFFSETTEEYNARIKAELDEKEEAERQLAELRSFEMQCVAALKDHQEVKTGLLSLLKDAVRTSRKSTLKE